MGKKKKRLQQEAILKEKLSKDNQPAQPVPKTDQYFPDRTKKILSRSSIGAIIWGIIFPSIILVYPMTWWIKVLLMIIIAIGIIIIIERSEWTINRTRSKKIGLIIAAILILSISSYFPIRDQYIKDQPVIISPTKFVASAGIFENRTLFEVHNRSNETIYTTWVKILAKKPFFEDFQIILTTDDGRRFVNPEGGESFNPEVLMLHVVDKDKQPVIFLVFRSLSPEETRRFRFYVQSGSNVPYNQKMTLRFSVIGYKDEPYRYGVQGDSASFQIKIPEGFSFPKKGIFFKMLEKNSPKEPVAKIPE